MQNKKKLLIKLFLSTLYLSAFTFGGGYVIITLMRKKFVDEYHWIDEDEMIDLVAIAQSSPGPIAVNGAIVVGYKLAKIPGIIVSVLATIIPPFVIISLIGLCYELVKDHILVSLMLQGMQAGAGAVITSVVFEMSSGILNENHRGSVLLMGMAFVLNYFFHVNVVYIILLTILLGVGIAYRERRQKP